MVLPHLHTRWYACVCITPGASRPKKAVPSQRQHSFLILNPPSHTPMYAGSAAQAPSSQTSPAFHAFHVLNASHALTGHSCTGPSVTQVRRAWLPTTPGRRSTKVCPHHATGTVRVALPAPPHTHNTSGRPTSKASPFCWQSARRRASALESPHTCTSRAGMPSTARVHAQPLWGSPSICKQRARQKWGMRVFCRLSEQRRRQARPCKPSSCT